MLCQGQKEGLCPPRKARKVGGHLLTPEAAMGQVLVGKLKNIKRPEGLEGGREGEGGSEREGGERGRQYLGIFQRTGQTHVPWKEDKNILAK